MKNFLLLTALFQAIVLGLYATGIYNHPLVGYGFLITAYFASLYFWYKSAKAIASTGDENGMMNIIFLMLIIASGMGVLGSAKVAPAAMIAGLTSFCYFGVWVASHFMNREA